MSRSRGRGCSYLETSSREETRHRRKLHKLLEPVSFHKEQMDTVYVNINLMKEKEKCVKLVLKKCAMAEQMGAI